MRNFQKAITMLFQWSQYADKGHTYRKVKSSHVQKWSSISLLVHSRCQIGLFPVWLEPMLQKGALRIKSYLHFIGLAIHWVLKSADSRTNIYNRGIGDSIRSFWMQKILKRKFWTSFENFLLRASTAKINEKFQIFW